MPSMYASFYAVLLKPEFHILSLFFLLSFSIRTEHQMNVSFINSCDGKGIDLTLEPFSLIEYLVWLN